MQCDCVAVCFCPYVIHVFEHPSAFVALVCVCAIQAHCPRTSSTVTVVHRPSFWGICPNA